MWQKHFNPSQNESNNKQPIRDKNNHFSTVSKHYRPVVSEISHAWPDTEWQKSFERMSKKSVVSEISHAWPDTEWQKSFERMSKKSIHYRTVVSVWYIYIQGQTQKSFRNLFDNWILSCWAATELSLMLNKICYLCSHICIFTAMPAYDVRFVSSCAIEWCSRTDL